MGGGRECARVDGGEHKGQGRVARVRAKAVHFQRPNLGGGDRQSVEGGKPRPWHHAANLNLGLEDNVSAVEGHVLAGPGADFALGQVREPHRRVARLVQGALKRWGRIVHKLDGIAKTVAFGLGGGEAVGRAELCQGDAHPLGVDKGQQVDALPGVPLPIHIHPKVGGVEVGDGAARRGHELAVGGGQELRRGRREAPQQLLEGLEGRALVEAELLAEPVEADHVRHHRPVVERVKPAPGDAPSVVVGEAP
mmetsp:Transcript_39060/g.87350  ORF Transcript_39060/g.87350 Transcript_39060/m.87350 type:complete len:251 (-) Transcript_39060:1571-2323(-)